MGQARNKPQAALLAAWFMLVSWFFFGPADGGMMFL
jgi:hypothetical protein